MTDSGYLVYQIIGTVFFYLFIFIKFFKLFFKNIYLFNYFLTLIISFRAPIVLHFWAVPRQLWNGVAAVFFRWGNFISSWAFSVFFLPIGSATAPGPRLMWGVYRGLKGCLSGGWWVIGGLRFGGQWWKWAKCRAESGRRWQGPQVKAKHFGFVSFRGIWMISAYFLAKTHTDTHCPPLTSFNRVFGAHFNARRRRFQLTVATATHERGSRQQLQMQCKRAVG